MIYRILMGALVLALAGLGFLLAPDTKPASQQPAAPAQPTQPNGNKSFNL